ncbi:hypothetical protein [Candidatus Methanarcanum hacksteinii]|uniref:hypothetical protein n=1 Tax=Candidatus Methanarcanum hacksteinii TaxID=2911857 RepID=UPI0037DD7754
MTREVIDETPDKWLDFFPHETFLNFINTLFEAIRGGSKSLWLTGNYGTGKSNAALVTQKLYMDDLDRVKKWFSDNEIAKTHEDMLDELIKEREEGTLVIYDYNASGISPNEEFIVRLEKTIITSLRGKYDIPAQSNLDAVIERITREGEHFFAVRDEISEEIEYLPPDLYDIDKLVELLKKEHETGQVNANILSDVQKVLHHDNIFLSVDVPTFRAWISEILKINGLKRILFIFDEFSDFIEENKTQLKTFEEITENPGANSFYLIPVTHLDIKAYWSENSTSASKANDRFYFKRLEMPNDTAFKLAAHAMKTNPDPEIAAEWKRMKDSLWSSVITVADLFESKDVSRQSFYDMLPIHPMAGFLLKFLSESVSSNQRSIFEYLKGGANGHEFQDFIKEGGPGEFRKQYLTVDYLWKYFMERDDLGQNKEVNEIRMYYERFRYGEYRNKVDEDQTIRVLKTVLLFSLLSRVNRGGHERLQPTVENIEYSFVGDNSIPNVGMVVNDLADKHCFSILNGNIELYSSSLDEVGLQDQIKEWSSKFNELISPKTKDELVKHTRAYLNNNSADRFDLRVTSVDHTNLASMSPQTREKYGSTSGQVCLWFVIAKNHDEMISMSDKIVSILNQLKSDYRIIIIAFDKITFCDKKADSWDEYVKIYARYMAENDTTAKNQLKKTLDKMEADWTYPLKVPTQKFSVYQWIDGSIKVEEVGWASFKSIVTGAVKRMLPGSVDHLIPSMAVFKISGLKQWARTGINFDSATTNPFKQVANSMKNDGIRDDEKWYLENPAHPLSKIHELFVKKIDNTIGRNSNFSIRKVFIELQKPPFGLQYNCLSALVIGFTLKEILKNNYQWTDEKLTGSLDENKLSEIIEEAIKNGETKPRNEKLICKLSKEDKAFIKKAPLMFGIDPIDDGTTNEAINNISNRIISISNRTPLWVMSDYIKNCREEKAECIGKLIEDLCTIMRTSSKGNTEERYNAIREIGSILINDEDIIKQFGKYMCTEHFNNAFNQYIDTNYPEIIGLAQSIDDNSHYYCKSILKKTASSASILWNRENLNDNVSETISEYSIVKVLKAFVSPHVFIDYEKTIQQLTYAINVKNKLPRQIIEMEYPSLRELLNALDSLSKTQTHNTTKEIQNCIENNVEIVRKMFFDSGLTETIRIIREKCDAGSLSDQTIIDILGVIKSGYESTEPIFIKDFKAIVSEYEKKSIAGQIKQRWTDLTGSNSISEWSNANKMPALYAIYDCSEGEMVIDALKHPGNYEKGYLERALEIINGATRKSIADCQIQYVSKVIPPKYSKLGVSFGSLVSFLTCKYGNNPDAWPDMPDVSEFLRQQYKMEYSSRVIENIKQINSDELKKRIIKLAEDNEDLGLLLWEWGDVSLH